MEQLYSYSNAAKLLDISVRTLKRHLEEKNLSVVYFGNRVRIQESVLQKLIVKAGPLEDYNIKV